MSSLYVGLLIGIVVTFIGQISRLVYEFFRDKGKRHREGLKNHFNQLEASVIKPVSDIMRGIAIYGETLSIKGASYGSPHYASLTRNFEQGDFYIFKLHFPDQAEKVTRQLNEVNKHNELCESFTNELKELIEEKTGLPVREGKGRPFVYTNVPHYLRQTLHQLAETESPTHDFRQARVERKNDFWEVLTVGTIYAEVTTEEEGNQCRCGLTKLIESTSLLEEMSDISKGAKRVENESRSIANLLDFTCWQYRESGQLLDEEKDCPYCQVIFHQKKRDKFV